MPIWSPRVFSSPSTSKQVSRYDDMHGRFCFGSKAESPAAQQVQHSSTEQELWSPQPPARPAPLEKRVSGLFAHARAARELAARAPAKENAKPSKEQHICCICLDAIEGRQGESPHAASLCLLPAHWSLRPSSPCCSALLSKLHDACTRKVSEAVV